MEIKELKRGSIPVRFGPVSNPEKYEIDLLEVAFRVLSIEDYDKVDLEIGDRLGESPYSDTDRASMPPTYLCEGSVWVNFYSRDGRYANVSLVPHLHGAVPPHHNFWLYWTDFNGSKDSDDRIPGHRIPTSEPIAVSINWGKETRKGTISIEP